MLVIQTSSLIFQGFRLGVCWRCTLKSLRLETNFSLRRVKSKASPLDDFVDLPDKPPAELAAAGFVPLPPSLHFPARAGAHAGRAPGSRVCNQELFLRHLLALGCVSEGTYHRSNFEGSVRGRSKETIPISRVNREQIGRDLSARAFQRLKAVQFS